MLRKGGFKRPAQLAKSRTEVSLSVPNSENRKFKALWCKASGRKHKKWEDDAILEVRARDRLAILKSLENKEISRGTGMKVTELLDIEPGVTILSFGGKEIQITEEIFGTEKQKSEEPQNILACPLPKIRRLSKLPPLLSRKFVSEPLEDAFVLPRPGPDQIFHHFGDKTGNVRDIVVDSRLSRILRPHQKEGIIFMYSCIMGFRASGYNGAILADEMGLGKTLQTIALIWTLLKQSPWNDSPEVKKCLIITPSSLIRNWAAEFNKWLGPERLKVFIVDSSSNRFSEYVKRPHEKVAILSYEMFVRCFEEISLINFDLLVADEGHRLKNSSIKASTLIHSMVHTKKRIVLTGTPVQNDLKEFYSLVSVVNPDVLGSITEFTKVYETPIVRSKQPNSSLEEIEEGNNKMEELNFITGKFILRRTQDIISSYLPPKTENLLFCRPSPRQIQLYEDTLDKIFDVGLHSECVFTTILTLRKICNDPTLVDEVNSDNQTFQDRGSKLEVVSLMLNSLKPKGEKIVLVSISTKVLDLLENLCKTEGHKYLRLDGSTSGPNRQTIVTRFNAKYSDDFVLLLSSKAGGTGLNLIGASRILLYDMDWNPANDIQAMARVWRDGQTKPVFVYRLLTTGTIEEKIFQRQITKQGLGDGVIDPKTAISHFTDEELKDLFTLTKDLDGDCETHRLIACESCNGALEINGGESLGRERKCQLGVRTGVIPRPKSTRGGQMKNLLKWRHFSANENIENMDDDLIHSVKDFLTFVFLNKIC